MGACQSERARNWSERACKGRSERAKAEATLGCRVSSRTTALVDHLDPAGRQVVAARAGPCDASKAQRRDA
eukprot:1271365-Pleurochrysis_carterae.AAC.1